MNYIIYGQNSGSIEKRKKNMSLSLKNMVSFVIITTIYK